MLLSQAAADSTFLDKLGVGVNGMSEQILKFLVPVAAVGAMAMALLEVYKKLRGSRRRFHARHWTKFMQQIPVDDAIRAAAYQQLLTLSSGVPVPAVAIKTLGDSGKVRNYEDPFIVRTEAEKKAIAKAKIRLIPDWVEDLTANAGGPGYAVFSQTTPVMVSIMMDAIDVALASAGPDETAPNWKLVKVMCHGADDNDFTTWFKRGESKSKKADEAATAARDIANAQSRLRQIAKRKLDAFAVFAEEQWANNNQFQSQILGGLIMFAAVLYTTGIGKSEAMKAIPISLFGGLLAPVAKDLVAAIKKARQP